MNVLNEEVRVLRMEIASLEAIVAEETDEKKISEIRTLINLLQKELDEKLEVLL